MECRLLPPQVRAFSRMLTCLSKVGDDVFLESDAHSNELIVRALNNSHSAFVAFRLGPASFDAFSLAKDANVHCRVAVKSVLSLFKAAHQIDSLTIAMDDAQENLVFTMACKHHIHKRFRLAVQECEVMHAVFDKDTCPHSLSCSPRLLAEYISLFPSSLEEMSIVATPNKLVLESHIDSGKDSLKHALFTHVSVGLGDLEHFAIRSPITITICLRELKAMQALCEANQENMSFHFSSASKPLLVRADADDGMGVELVLATLYDPDDLSCAGGSQGRASPAPVAAPRPTPTPVSPASPASPFHSGTPSQRPEAVASASSSSRVGVESVPSSPSRRKRPRSRSGSPAPSPSSSSSSSPTPKSAVAAAAAAMVVAKGAVVQAEPSPKRARVGPVVEGDSHNDAPMGTLCEDSDEFVAGTPPSSPAQVA